MYSREPAISIDETVRRTIASKVTSDLANSLDITKKAFIAIDELFATDGVVSGAAITMDKNILERPLADRIIVKVETNNLNDLNTGSHVAEVREILRNKHCVVSTQYANTDLKFNISYQTMSLVSANALLSTLRNYLLTRGGGYDHLVEYYYHIPPVILGLLEDIYTTAKINIPTTDSMLKFIKESNIVNSIRLSSDINGLEGTVGLVAMNQTKIHGIVDVDIRELNREFNDATNMWSVELTYATSYLSPIGFIVDFATLVNNNLLPAHYYVEKTISSSSPKFIDDIYPYYHNKLLKTDNYAIIPPYDNHAPKPVKNRILSPVASVLTAISPTDKVNLLNLHELVYYEFKDELINYMKVNHEGMTVTSIHGYDSILIVDLYQGKYLKGRRKLLVDADLNITSTEDLELDGVYRIVISVVTDKNALSAKGLESIRGLTIDLGGLLNTDGTMWDGKHRGNDDSFDTMLSIIDSISDDYRSIDFDTSRSVRALGSMRRLTSQVSTVTTLFKRKD